jgi:hypothetical protein
VKAFAAVLQDAKTNSVALLALDEKGQLVDSSTGEKVPEYGREFLGRRLLKEVEEFEKYFYKTARPSELLTYWGVSPQVEGGQVTGLVVEKQVGTAWHENPLEEWQFDLLELDPQDLGCVDEHPEGSDRGGYVPTLTNGCHYDENGGEWQG